MFFEECETRSCIEITIIDDLILEMDEYFSISLERTTDLDIRITLSPTSGEVVIVDDDGTTICSS